MVFTNLRNLMIDNDTMTTTMLIIISFVIFLSLLTWYSKRIQANFNSNKLRRLENERSGK